MLLRKCIYIYTHTQCVKYKSEISQEEIFYWFIGWSGKFWKSSWIDWILLSHRLLLVDIVFVHHPNDYPHDTKHLHIWQYDRLCFLTLLGLIGRHISHFNFLCKVLPDYFRRPSQSIYIIFKWQILFLLIKDCWSLRIYNSEPN